MQTRTITARWFKSFLVGALAVLLTCSVAAMAQERKDRPRFKDNGKASAAQTRAVGADAPNARMVALVRAPDAVIVMKKGVQSVERIARGVYCIRPEAATGIDPLTAVAVVSIEYFYSLFNEVQVQWARRDSGCGNNRFGVYTLADGDLDAVYDFSNAAGFVIYVP